MNTFKAMEAPLIYKPIAGLDERLMLRLIYGVSAAVFLAVAVLVLLKSPEQREVPIWATWLPTLNAVLNGACFVLLLFALVAVKQKKYALHMRINLVSFVFSSLFLVSYVLYHSFGIETTYPAGEPLRNVYLGVLLTHIPLAAIVLPLVLLSFYRALSGQIQKHKQIVKIAYPMWLYVTFTGVVVYIMISPFYPWNN